MCTVYQSLVCQGLSDLPALVGVSVVAPDAVLARAAT